MRQQVFRRDDQLHHLPSRMRRGDREQHLICHRHRPGAASVDQRHAQVQGGRHRGGDTGDFCGEHLGGADAAKTRRQFATTVVDKQRINLMVEETVDLQDPPPEVAAVVQDALSQRVHG